MDKGWKTQIYTTPSTLFSKGIVNGWRTTLTENTYVHSVLKGQKGRDSRRCNEQRAKKIEGMHKHTSAHGLDLITDEPL